MIWMIIGYGKSYIDKCSRDHIGAYAAQAAYFMIMSAIPFLMILFAIMGFLPSSGNYIYTFLNDVLPDAVTPYIESVLNMVLQASVGVVSVTAVMAVWSSGKAFQNLMVGLNVVNQIKETRNWFVTRFWAVIYTIFLLMAIVMVMFMLVFTQQLQGFVKDQYFFLSYMVGIRPFFRWVFVFIFLVIFFTFLFSSLPNKKISFKSQLPGGVICATSWYIFTAILTVWVGKFKGFSMYGALATIMIMMFWLYFCMYFMLMAAEANMFFKQAFGLAWQRYKERVKTKYFSKWTNKN